MRQVKMEFTITFMSFYVIQVEFETDKKSYTHYQTLDEAAFEKKVQWLPF